MEEIEGSDFRTRFRTAEVGSNQPKIRGDRPAPIPRGRAGKTGQGIVSRFARTTLSRDPSWASAAIAPGRINVGCPKDHSKPLILLILRSH